MRVAPGAASSAISAFAKLSTTVCWPANIINNMLTTTSSCVQNPAASCANIIATSPSGFTSPAARIASTCASNARQSPALSVRRRSMAPIMASVALRNSAVSGMDMPSNGPSAEIAKGTARSCTASKRPVQDRRSVSARARLRSEFASAALRPDVMAWDSGRRKTAWRGGSAQRTDRIITPSKC